jgi:ABC-type microcin C transport system duplicated ATPase subunit YejF
MNAPPLLSVHELQKHFPVGSNLIGRPTGVVHAVDGVSFDIRKGETLALAVKFNAAGALTRCRRRHCDRCGGASR